MASRGTSTLTFRRLFSRAPRTWTKPSPAWSAVETGRLGAVSSSRFCLACTASTVVVISAGPELQGTCRDAADGFTLKHSATLAGRGKLTGTEDQLHIGKGR